MNETRELVSVWYTAKYDRVFKTIFLKEQDKSLMEAVLYAVISTKLNIIHFHITDLAVRNVNEKVKVVDAVIECDDGKHFIVEVNTSKDPLVKERNLNYFHSYSSQKFLRGDEYSKKYEWILINLNFNAAVSDDLIEVYEYMTDNLKRYTNTYKIYDVNVAKAKELWYNKDVEREKYLPIAMLDMNQEDLDEMSKESDIVKRFYKELRDLNMNSDFVRELTYEEDREKLYKSIGFDEGRELGEKNKQVEIAKNMLKDNFDAETISKLTGLDIAEIETLKNQRKEA